MFTMCNSAHYDAELHVRCPAVDRVSAARQMTAHKLYKGISGATTLCPRTSDKRMAIRFLDIN